jgi:signal peptidase I
MTTRAALSQRPLIAGLATGVTLLVAIALWVLFAPQSLGGDFAYVFVRGNSMVPAMLNDDIVLLRRADDYDVGDAVAYRHPDMGVVLHRIVEDDGVRFTLRGDNKDSLDSYRPTSAEIVGRTWAVVPGGGRVVREIQRPRNAALLVIAALALAAPAAAPARRRRRNGGRGSPSSSSLGGGLSLHGSAGKHAVAVLAAVMVGSVALLLLLRVQGPTSEITETVAFTERGAFDYRKAVAGGVYDADRLRAPEPLFRKLTDELPLRFEYELATVAADVDLDGVTGSYRLVAEIAQQNGWKRTVVLAPTMLFAGEGFTAEAVLDLGGVDKLIASMEELTEVRSEIYQLRITAEVTAEGDVAGQPFSREFGQSIEFRFTALQLQFDDRNSTIESTDVGTVEREVLVERTLTLPLAGVGVPYSSFPQLAALGIGISVLGSLFVAGATFFVQRSGERERLRARYGHMIVRVERDDVTISGKLVTVDRFDDLVRIAQFQGLAILHSEGDSLDEYFLLDRDVTYRYTSWKRPQGRRSETLASMADGAPAERAA